MRELKDLRVLFVGDLNQGTRSLMRAQKIHSLCGELVTLSNTPVPFIAGINKPNISSRVFNKLRIPLDEAGINKALEDISDSYKNFDIAWIDKSNMLKPETLRKLKKINSKTVLISVSEDDMYALHNRSRYYENCLPLYDLVFTTKTYNIEELMHLGAKRAEYFLDSYDEDFHRPLAEYEDVESKDINVCFIGTYEPERADTISWLGNNGIQIAVYGNGWESLIGSHQNIQIKKCPVYGAEYIRTINRTKINLGFLRKINRDQVTSRSMEITGAGSFLLAERTERHLQLFEEGIEAEFFSSDQELLEKINAYLSKPEEIKRIGQSGRLRCIRSGYGMKGLIASMLTRALNDSNVPVNFHVD